MEGGHVRAGVHGTLVQAKDGIFNAQLPLIYFDFDFVSVRVANKRGKPFAAGAIVDLCLRGFKAFALEGSDHVVDTGPGGAEAEVLLAQIGRGSGIDGGGFEEIKDRISGAQRHNLIASLGSSFAFHRKAEAIAIKLLHRHQVLCHQGDVIKTFIGKHESILPLAAHPHKSFLWRDTSPAPVEHGPS